jgi:hypothetical protein
MWVASAVRAVEVTKREGGSVLKVFASLVNDQRWLFVTNQQEDTAHAWLKRHEHGDPRPRMGPRNGPRGEPGSEPEDQPPTHGNAAPAGDEQPALSDDAQTVRGVLQCLASHRLNQDPVHFLKEAVDPAWTRERYDRAKAELDDI